MRTRFTASRAASTAGRCSGPEGRRLLAAQPRPARDHQPPVDGVPVRPRHGPGEGDGGRQFPDRAPDRGGVFGVDPASGAEGRQGAGHDRRGPSGEVPAARGRRDAFLREGHRLEHAPRDAAQPRRGGQEVGLPFEAVELPGHGAEADVIITITSSFAPTLLADMSAPARIWPAWAPTPRASRRSRPRFWAGHGVLRRGRAIGLHRRGAACHRRGLIAEGDIAQVGAVINGTHGGRASDEEITLVRRDRRGASGPGGGRRDRRPPLTAPHFSGRGRRARRQIVPLWASFSASPMTLLILTWFSGPRRAAEPSVAKCVSTFS
jgi:hypothetical protein